MKKKLLFIPLVGMLLAGCSLNDLMFWKQKQDKQGQNDEKSSGNTGETGEKEPGESGDDKYTATIQTSGSGLSERFSEHTNFDTDIKVESLGEFFKSQLQHDNLIKSMACTNLHTQTWDNVSYLQFGSGSGVGALAIESDVAIYKVAVKVLCFANYDSYHQITNIDSWSHFLINEQDNDMTYDGSTNPSVMSFEKSFESGINTINLASKDGRVFLKEMTITWKNQ